MRPPVELSDGALQRTLDKLSIDRRVIAARANVAAADRPAALAGYEMTAWRWLGPGISCRHIILPETGSVKPDATRVFMLKAAPGTVMPQHKHTGTEWTCILQGAFKHAGGRFGPGDFDEADSSDEHDPVIEDGVECICLVALHGEVRFKSWIGRLLQPFVRM